MLFTSWCCHFEICFSFLETVDKNVLNTKPLFICLLMNHFWSLTSKIFSFQPDDQLLFLHWMLLKLCATQHHLILEIVYYAARVYRVFMLLVRPHLAGLWYSACVHICSTDERKKLRCWLKTLFRKYQYQYHTIQYNNTIRVYCENTLSYNNGLCYQCAKIVELHNPGFLFSMMIRSKNWHQPCILLTW